MLCVDIPAHMFVTCLALVLDPVSGEVEFANAGHDVPYVRTRRPACRNCAPAACRSG